MITYTKKAGSTDVSVVLRIIDSTDGTPETGVVYNTAGIDLEYRREGAVSVDITEVTLAALTTAHTDGGFLHIGNGNYRLDLPDAACAAGVVGVLVHGTITGMVVLGCYIQLVAYDPADAVRLGLTALPAAAANAAGGLPISAGGGLALDTKLANTNEVTAARMGALTDLIDGGRLDLLIDAIKACTDLVTAARMGTLTDWIDGGRLDLLLDAIPTTPMRGTDSAALASVCTEARLAELGATNLPADVDTLLTRIVGTLLAGSHTAQTGDTFARIGALGAGLTALATAAELAKVPKSDAAVSWNATALADIAKQAESVLSGIHYGDSYAECGVFPFQMLSASGVPVPSLTVTAWRKIDDADWEAADGTVSYVAASAGDYYFSPATGDTQGTHVRWEFRDATQAATTQGYGFMPLPGRLE